MKRLTYLALTVVSLLVACTGQVAVEPAGDAATPPAEATDSVLLPTDTDVPPTQVPTEAPTAAVVEETVQQPPTAEPAIEPSPTAAIEATAEVEDPATLQVISGQTPEGAFFYGSPDAPVTLFDYSDFL